MLSESEISFIKEIDERFPEKGILDAFNRYSAVDPADRMDMAEDDLKNIDRTGWVRIGVPKGFIQNIFQHEQSMMHMVGLLNGSDNALNIAKYHDHAEAIATDFTPKDDITWDEKHNLEKMAAKIIFEYFSEEHKAWLVFEDRKTDDAILASNIDQLEMACYAMYIEENHPEMRDTLTPFWNFADKKITTSLVRKTFDELRAYREGTVAEKAIYADMKHHYDEFKFTV